MDFDVAAKILCRGFPLVTSSYHLGGIENEKKQSKCSFSFSVTSTKYGSDFSSNVNGSFEDIENDSQ